MQSVRSRATRYRRSPSRPPRRRTEPRLCRIATINDLHIGCDFFGLLDRMTGAVDGHPARGPVRPERDPRRARLGRATPAREGRSHPQRERGRVGDGRRTAGRAARQRRSHPGQPRHEEVAPCRAATGARVRTGCISSMASRSSTCRASAWCSPTPRCPTSTAVGSSHLAADIVRVASRASGGVLVALHHHPQRYRVPTFVPSGIPGPESMRFLRALAAARPTALVVDRSLAPPPSLRTLRRHRDRGGIDQGLPRHVDRLRRARGRHPPGRPAHQRPVVPAVARPHQPRRRRLLGPVVAGTPRRPLLLHAW